MGFDMAFDKMLLIRLPAKVIHQIKELIQNSLLDRKYSCGQQLPTRRKVCVQKSIVEELCRSGNTCGGRGMVNVLGQDSQIPASAVSSVSRYAVVLPKGQHWLN